MYAEDNLDNVSSECKFSEHLSHLDPALQRFDLLEVFSVGPVGVVQSSLQFPQLALVLLLHPGDLGLHPGLNLHQSSLELLDDTLAGTSVDVTMVKVLICGTRCLCINYHTSIREIRKITFGILNLD